MAKHVWKIEYSLTLMAVFTIILFMIPTSFSSKTAKYISEWNEAYSKVDYMFTAMGAHADSDIVKGLKNAKTPEKRQELMMKLVQPYLRLEEVNGIEKKYHQHYLNGSVAKKDDFYYFSNLYMSENGRIVGIKDIKNKDEFHPIFMILIDMNGLSGPNTWGRDIYGLDIYSDGIIKALGYGWDIDLLRNDCSTKGTGVSCSHFYRIGGEFNE